jgi:hypothetical protein
MHRYVGVVIAAVIVLLAITGLLLNHSDQLGLDRQEITLPTFLSVSPLAQSPEFHEAFKLSSGWLVRVNDEVYFDQRHLYTAATELMGALMYHNNLLVASAHTLRLYTAKGELIEEINLSSELDSSVTKIGLDKNMQLIIATQGQQWQADEALLDWRTDVQPDIQWIEKATLPLSVQDQLVARYSGRSISVERLLFELHSARIFGPFGKWLLDLVAIGVILLATSGPFIWWLASRRNRARRRSSARGNKL